MTIITACGSASAVEEMKSTQLVPQPYRAQRTRKTPSQQHWPLAAGKAGYAALP